MAPHVAHLVFGGFVLLIMFSVFGFILRRLKVKYWWAYLAMFILSPFVFGILERLFR